MLVSSGNLILPIREDIKQRYERVAMLGEGSYGRVYKVKNQVGELRALKVIDKRGEVDMAEIENMKKLDHPNIMSVYEVASDENHLYLVQELCEGQELFAEIHKRIQQHKNFTEEEVRVIFKQILSAVAYAHDKNIMHRDIKPENILISQDYHIKIIDWGLSKEVQNEEVVRQKIGTVDYAAPEVLANQGYDKKCDIWSCGVILYILLSGETPFPGRTTGEIEKMILKHKISMKQKVWKSISSEAKDFMKKLLQPDPKKRCSARDALEQKWIQTQVNQQNQDDPNIKYRLEKLFRFCCESKLVQATIHLMIQQNITQAKLKKLRQTFEKLDRNGDGKLSMHELKAYCDDSIDVTEVFKRVDTDGNGFIEFTEFVAAAVDMRKLASAAQLREAFSLLDENGDGYLEIDEIKKIFGGKIQVNEEKGWEVLLREIDSNNDGKISMQEYEEALERFVESTPKSNFGSQDQEPIIQKKVKSEIVNKEEPTNQAEAKESETKKEAKAVRKDQSQSQSQSEVRTPTYNLRSSKKGKS